MTTMSARRATATKVRALSEPDLQLGLAEIKGLSAVTGWIRHGKPVEDVETEVENVIDNQVRRAGYIKLRDRICKRYRIDEREFVRQLFQRMSLCLEPNCVIGCRHGLPELKTHSEDPS